MSNPFQHLSSVGTSLREQESMKKTAELAIRQIKHKQFLAISPMVERVIKQLCDAAFKNMKTHTEAKEDESYYFWGIGYPSEMDGYHYFQCAIRIQPIWSENGELIALDSSLMLPNEEKLKNLGAKDGLQFCGEGATMEAKLRHSPDEKSLITSLQKLLPADFLENLLSEMKHYWGEQY